MSPDDPRHGKWAGYNAGCRDTCCREAARKYQARLHHDHHNGRTRTIAITGARRRIHALMRIGWSAELIAQQVGLSTASIHNLSGRPKLKFIHRSTHDLIDRVYNQLSGRPGPSRETVKHATRLGYASPLAWEDDAIDDPNAEPVGLPDGRTEVAGFDQSRVERRILGDRTVRLHKGEAAEIVRRMLADGWTQNGIRRHTGLKVERYIARAEMEKAA